jgi:NAD(P)-dependent dehydrogenase (short-subunit alcohol dehydrogenase family)
MTTETLLSDKVVVIAGGAPEMAEAVARLLATRGAAGLMICGRGAERGQALAAIVSAAGCPTHFLPADLSRTQDCAAVITEAELVFGRIDVLIVGPGEVPYLPLDDTTPDKLDQLLAAKVRAPFLLLQGGAALMKRTGVDGTVIVTIGGTGADGPRTVAAAAGRGALAAMAQGFAASLAGDRIQVFGLAIDDERTGVAATPLVAARVIADLAAGASPPAPGSITFATPPTESTAIRDPGAERAGNFTERLPQAGPRRTPPRASPRGR